jgi:hypothetical protein
MNADLINELRQLLRELGVPLAITDPNRGQPISPSESISVQRYPSYLNGP